MINLYCCSQLFIFISIILIVLTVRRNDEFILKLNFKRCNFSNNIETDD